MKLRGLAFAVATLWVAPVALAQDLPFEWPDPATTQAIDPTAKMSPHWVAYSGRATLRFNPALLEAYGIELSAKGKAGQVENEIRLEVRDQGGMTFKVGGAQFQGFVDGSLQLRDGFKLRRGDEELKLLDLRLVPRSADTWQLELVDAKGTVWFINDHVHYQLSPDRTKIEMFNMDLRATPVFARFVNDDNLIGHTVGSMAVSSQVRTEGEGSFATKTCAAPNWPNTPGAPGGNWIADVLLENMSTIDWKRGPGGPKNDIIFAPNATLRNANNPNTAEVPWYAKFSGYRPPYNNDQHPYLIWNLYRLNADGFVEQIGRSGIKHAFLTLNTGCTDPTCSNVSGAILGMNCGDVYSSGNNDSGGALGPRREVVPHLGIWGRCGSVYDPDCNHVANNYTDDSYRDRLGVQAAAIDPTQNTGATYFMDSWYVIRDDVNIYNTMGYRRVNPVQSGTWQLQNVGGQPFTVGPFLNFWVNPSNPGANNQNVEISTNEGRTRIAVRVTQVGNAWRYQYAVMNFSFSRPTMNQVSVPGNPSAEVYQVTRNFGYSAFAIPYAGAAPTSIRFSDGDTSAGNDWSTSTAGNQISFTGAEGSALNWGSMYSFSFESSAPPAPATVRLNILDPGATTFHETTILAPVGTGDNVFADGYE